MIEAFDAVVVYKDGRRVTAHVGMFEMMAVERKFPSESRTIVHPDGSMETFSPNPPHQQMALYGLWVASGSPDEFDEWVKTVEDLEDKEEVDSTPSKPAPGAGSPRKSQRKPKSTPRASTPATS